ncbi:MAG: hypothetical protein ACPGQL_03420 [Thermoplasmatota archaeon]
MACIGGVHDPVLDEVLLAIEVTDRFDQLSPTTYDFTLVGTFGSRTDDSAAATWDGTALTTSGAATGASWQGDTLIVSVPRGALAFEPPREGDGLYIGLEVVSAACSTDEYLALYPDCTRLFIQPETESSDTVAIGASGGPAPTGQPATWVQFRGDAARTGAADWQGMASGPPGIHRTAASSSTDPVVGDLDGDGDDEIIIADGLAVQAFDNAGTLQPLWRFEFQSVQDGIVQFQGGSLLVGAGILPPQVATPVLLESGDGDAGLEVAVWRGDRVYLLDGDTATLYDHFGDQDASEAPEVRSDDHLLVADVDGDPYAELVLGGTGTDGYDVGQRFVLEARGTQLKAQAIDSFGFTRPDTTSAAVEIGAKATLLTPFRAPENLILPSLWMQRFGAPNHLIDYPGGFDADDYDYPAAADLDGDGVIEIVLTGASGLLLADSPGPFFGYAFTVDDRDGPTTPVLLGDVTGDGEADLVFGDGGGLTVWDYDGSVLTLVDSWEPDADLERPARLAAGVGDPALVDWDQDGIMSIGVGREGEWISLGWSQGQLVEEWRVDLRQTPSGAPAFGDLDGDGDSEVVTLTSGTLTSTPAILPSPPNGLLGLVPTPTETLRDARATAASDQLVVIDLG